MSERGTQRDVAAQRAESSSSRISRRRVLQTSAVAGGLSFAGCFGGGGGDGDTLTYISRGGATQDAEREVMEQWTEESGVEVEHQEAAADGDILDLIAENPGGYDFTNLVPAAFAMHEMLHDGELFAPIDVEKVPNYQENINDDWKDAPFLQDRDYGLVYYNNSQGISYNTELVDEAPTSWEDFKSSSYQGEISMHDNALTRFANTCAALDYDPSEAVADDGIFEEVRQEMLAFHENVFDYWTAGDEWMRFMREEQATAVEGWGGRTRVLQDEGVPVEYVIPDEGCLTYTTGWTIVDDSENKEEVYDLLNFLYERENAVQLAEGHNYPVLLNDPPEEITSLPDYTESPDDLIWFSWVEMIKAQSEIEQLHAEIKSA
jgi:spermidine/putrescine-binding protein